MNFRSLRENDLADFAVNIADLLAGTDLSAIEPHVRTELLAALGTLPATLATQKAEGAIAEDVRKAAISARNDTRSQISAVLVRVRDALRTGLAPKVQYDLCGFDFPKTRGAVTANDPTNLVATGASNRVNRLTFDGNNVAGSVTYEIWRLNGDTTPFTIIGTTRKQTFVDRPVTPGEYYAYKVRAVAATNVSNFSNTAVVYGAS